MEDITEKELKDAQDTLEKDAAYYDFVFYNPVYRHDD